MLDDAELLHRAILLDTADDLPRLVLADWLEEHGREPEAKTLRWFLDHPDYRQSNPIQVAVPNWPEADRFKADPSCVVNRGFVSEVRLTLAQFVGGACDECGTRHEPSPVCPGHGGTPGLAAELFKNHPITRVVLTDREPVLITAPLRGWHWAAGAPRFSRDVLPVDLIERVRSLAEFTGDGWQFESRQDAIDALSAACVAYGLAAAGLTAPMPVA